MALRPSGRCAGQANNSEYLLKNYGRDDPGRIFTEGALQAAAIKASRNPARVHPAPSRNTHRRHMTGDEVRKRVSRIRNRNRPDRDNRSPSAPEERKEGKAVAALSIGKAGIRRNKFATLRFNLLLCLANRRGP
jgi:hypothetical protein